MKSSKKPYKTRWFYCFGSQGEMIIDNNQNKIAKIHNLSQGCISACLRGERQQHRSWKFTLIENPCSFVPAEKKKKSVILEKESDSPEKPTPAQKKESDAMHMQAATETGIRHLMGNLYPQWKTEKSEGAIFTSP